MKTFLVVALSVCLLPVMCVVSYTIAENKTIARVQSNCERLGAFTVKGRFYQCEEKTKFYVESEDFK